MLICKSFCVALSQMELIGVFAALSYRSSVPLAVMLPQIPATPAMDRDRSLMLEGDKFHSYTDAMDE